jgi:outer membrane receptor protein involved in Fe transport
MPDVGKTYPANSLPCGAFRKRICATCAVFLPLGAVPAASVGDAPQAAELEEIVVTASLRPAGIGEFPVSTTVLAAGVIEAAGLQHLQDVLGLVPNLNWAGGTSRPRYFQLRGVGELEQYQGAPNPSVGFLIDDIDFSGVGMAATSFDVGQVEVLRGPQGTRYGANALAGLINVRTRDATPDRELYTEVIAGDDGMVSAGLVAGGALGRAGPRQGAWRFAVQRAASDGFRRNRYLDRDTTNGRDELTARTKLALEPAEGWQVGLTLMHASLDNGFDAFAPDNSFDTLSDRPGQDLQRSGGVALRIDGDFDRTTVRSTTAYADSEIVYSFDGDWGNDPYWGAYAPYDYFSRYERERRTLSQDLRLVSDSTARGQGFGWLLGVYALRLEEQNLQRDEFAGQLLRPLLSTDYSATNAAAYGEAEWGLGGRLVLSAGLRVETRSAEYDDSDDTRFAPRDTMAGGHLSMSGDLDARNGWYVTASRGYKAGGFNIGLFVPADRREFEPEFLWNLEVGLHSSSDDARLSADVAVFHMWRESQQVATSFQLDPGDPLSYVFCTDNAARGRNAGIEATVAWRPVDGLTVGATLGLLRTEYVGYAYGSRDLDGREQAHAPDWQYSLSAEWNSPRGWMARADLTGSDAFYFDTSHDQQSDPYSLLNLKAGYAAGRWSAYLWGRNVFDERYAVRGFYFGLEPPDYDDKLYVQQGDPRQFGVTLSWSL